MHFCCMHFCRAHTQVASVTGSKILRVLKSHGLAPEIPEDLYHMIKKISGLLVTARRLRVRKARRHAHCLLVRAASPHAVSIRKHLERSRKDKDSKFRCVRARRLAVWRVGGVVRSCSTTTQAKRSRAAHAPCAHPPAAPPSFWPRRLILVESRIHRLARYYKRVKKLPPTW